MLKHLGLARLSMTSVGLGLVAAVYLIGLIVLYDVPYGGSFNREQSGSVADWTSGLATTATLIFAISRLRADRRSDVRAEARSIVATTNSKVVSDPLDGNVLRVSCSLGHYGTRPIVLLAMEVFLRHETGTLNDFASDEASLNDRSPETSIGLHKLLPLVIVPGDRDGLSEFEASMALSDGEHIGLQPGQVRVRARWIDAWGQTRSWPEEYPIMGT